MGIKVTEQNLGQMLNELEPLVSELPEKDRGFANSLLQQGRKRSTLSSKQMYWVGRLMEVAVHGTPPQPTSHIQGGLMGLMELFAKAKQHLKYPKITLEFENVTFQLILAGPKSKKPGWVNITDGEPYGYNQWFGRVSPEGVWEQPHNIEEEIKIKLTRVLDGFSHDAAVAAAKYGHLSGNCCFCHKKLTTENSTAVGYGPICAGHYGLPWGGKS